MDSVYFRSKFWDSDTVTQLQKDEILLSLYLILNENIPPSGIYKIYWEQIRNHTRLVDNEIHISLKTLIKKKKIYVHNNWIFVVDFLRETFKTDEKILSPKIKTTIKNQFAQKVPKEIIYCFDYYYHKLSIPYKKPFKIPYNKPLDILIKILDFRLEILDFRLESKEVKEVGAEETSAPSDIFKILLKDGTEYKILKEDINRWIEVYPDIDVKYWLHRIVNWNIDRPANRKTRRGIKKHITGWLGKEQDKTKTPSKVEATKERLRNV